MKQTNTIMVFMVLLLAPLAGQAHPRIQACGGLAVHYGEGIFDGEQLPRDIENRIERYLHAADASPGIAIAIVKGDRVVLARGFGYRDLASCDRVSSDTRYYLKSTTKTLLGLSAAILQEEGAIELDAPISEYLPDLRLPEALSARRSRSALI